MTKFLVSNSVMHGKGLFATVDIQKDAHIGYIAGKKKKRVPKTKIESLSIPTWFGVSRQLWIDPQNSAFRYLNHSCEPNAAIIGVKTLVAMKEIKKGDEITIDYSMTDADPLWEMRCACGSEYCRTVIKSIQNLPVSVYRRHMPYIPKYFQHVFLRAHTKSQLESGHERQNVWRPTIRTSAAPHPTYAVR